MTKLFPTAFCLSVAMAMGALAGCQQGTTTPPPVSTQTESHQHDHDHGASATAEIAANLAKLSPSDRSLAEAQGYCAVQPEEALGSMGVPSKVMVKDQPVFVCCKGCEKKAVQNANATLAEVAHLKAKVANEQAQATGDK